MTRVRTCLLAAVGLLLSVLAPVATPLSAGAAAPVRGPSLSPSVAVPGQAVRATGALPTKVVRPVKLQRLTGQR